ncbi:YicC family protein [Natronospirillum operosum]|uniref:YicC family protein n=1 Tax=Natronospirillum operosum TaxID=2759953 RepID=A0A4Z0WA01_9GAMM|nr:YicC/YloC family endoribonuclease [Natronospirillum operosum]TGG91347.1 YicC family protein [Natronospirillum operosum]
MTLSMTGFARSAAPTEQGELQIEIRTVNHRYLDVSCRLPEALRFLEPWLRERVRARLSRGKVDIGLRWQNSAAVAASLQINRPRLEAVYAALDEVASVVPDSQPPTRTTLLGWPGVVQEEGVDEAALQQAVAPLLELALDELQAHRQREGEAMAMAIRQRLDEIEQIVARLQQDVGGLQAHLQARLEERLARLQAELDPERLQQEVALLLQKADVAEELDRLQTHVTETRRVLTLDEPAGRRLDFLMQEFNREANTLASKASQSSYTQAAIDLKVLIEQMREQIQNIE